MDHIDIDPLFPNACEGTAKEPRHEDCRQVAMRPEDGNPICNVDELVQKIVTRTINRYDAADEADSELDMIMLKRRGIDFRLGELPDGIKKAVRTGSWYRGSSSEEAWPLDENDDQELMERDPRLEEPWRYFEDVDDFLGYEAEVLEGKRRKNLCAAPGDNMGTDSFLKDKKPISEKESVPLVWMIQLRDSSRHFCRNGSS